MQRQPLSYRLERITSKDGSTLTYRQLGEGPVSFLLMGGDKSPPYLRLALDELAAALPHARRIEFRGLNHQGPDNSEQPAVVAAKLREFFA